MSSSITRTLFHWMKDKRIIDQVAKRLDLSGPALAAELRSAPHQAKLGADRLVPMFDAIRQTQYAGELDKIIRPFLRELEGNGYAAHASASTDTDQVRELMKCVGDLLTASAQIKDTGTEREMEQLMIKVRTELIPAAYKLEDILVTRLARAQEANQTVRFNPNTQEAGA